jgi:hypothetical protein
VGYPTERAEEIRQDISNIIRQWKPRKCRQKSNITRTVHDALLTLKNKKDTLILPPDKGNATVVVYTEDCHNKIRAVLSEPVYVVC